jgi:hypothetical protein
LRPDYPGADPEAIRDYQRAILVSEGVTAMASSNDI